MENGMRRSTPRTTVLSSGLRRFDEPPTGTLRHIREATSSSSPTLTMRFSTIIALAASLGLAAASPSAEAGNTFVARSGDGATGLAARSGCGSTGPLGDGHFIWWITADCQAGTQKTCQVTDASGCVPGDTSKIGSVEVDNPDDTVQIAKKDNTNTLSFTCPPEGKVRCQANFNDNDDGPGYSLRVF